MSIQETLSKSISISGCDCCRFAQFFVPLISHEVTICHRVAIQIRFLFRQILFSDFWRNWSQVPRLSSELRQSQPNRTYPQYWRKTIFKPFRAHQFIAAFITVMIPLAAQRSVFAKDTFDRTTGSVQRVQQAALDAKTGELRNQFEKNFELVEEMKRRFDNAPVEIRRQVEELHQQALDLYGNYVRENASRTPAQPNVRPEPQTRRQHGNRDQYQSDQPSQAYSNEAPVRQDVSPAQRYPDETESRRQLAEDADNPPADLVAPDTSNRRPDSRTTPAQQIDHSNDISRSQFRDNVGASMQEFEEAVSSQQRSEPARPSNRYEPAQPSEYDEDATRRSRSEATTVNRRQGSPTTQSEQRATSSRVQNVTPATTQERVISRRPPGQASSTASMIQF